MKNDDVTLNYVCETNMSVRELESTLLWKRNQEAAEKLNRAGFETRMESELAGKFMYILVYAPDGNGGEWANAEEAANLAARAANLSATEAWARWIPTIERFYQPTDREIYDTDMQTARALKAQGDFETAHMISSDAARALRAVKSDKRSSASRINGRKGGRPRRSKP